MLRNRLLCTAICVAFIAALPIAPLVATPQTGIAVPEMAVCESLINDFVANEGLPGLSFALAREGPHGINMAAARNDPTGAPAVYQLPNR